MIDIPLFILSPRVIFKYYVDASRMIEKVTKNKVEKSGVVIVQYIILSLKFCFII